MCHENVNEEIDRRLKQHVPAILVPLRNDCKGIQNHFVFNQV